jgi:glutamate synthase (NADPH/NADH) small chain
VDLTKLKLLVGDRHGRVVKALCQHMRPCRPGRKCRVVPVEGSVFVVETDLVILAPQLGPEPVLAATTEGLEVDAEGWIITDDETGQTTREGVFAAGDNVGKLHLAVMAIKEGRKVAAGIHRYITLSRPWARLRSTRQSRPGSPAGPSAWRLPRQPAHRLHPHLRTVAH